MEPEQKKSSMLLWICLAVGVLIVAGLGAWALSANGPETDSEAATKTTNDATSSQLAEGSDTTATDTPASAEAATLVFTDNGFEPSSITVRKGTVITIKNDSSNSVQFSSDDHPSHRDNPEMNAATISAGASTTYTANTVGTFGFHDHIDSSKTGTVTVTE